jgi:hypothetical protein
VSRVKKRKPIGGLSHRELRSIFASFEEAAEVLELLPKYLSERFGRSKSSGFGFFGIERLKVNFVADLARIEIENIYATNTATILLPLIKGESEEDREERAKETMRYFLPCLPDSQERATAQFYELIKAAGKQDLLLMLREKYKK